MALAVAAAGDALTPPGNMVVRVAPGAGFWVLLCSLGLMVTDAITRLRPGPLLRVVALVLFIGVATLSLAHGTFDHLSVMREYTVNAARFALELRQHLWLALGSLGAALLVGLPLGVAVPSGSAAAGRDSWACSIWCRPFRPSRCLAF